ncbi:MAG TPA: hypothetical protein VLM89_00590, partial [Phycisphaerae bacterium]|nr:hypothetical protein [Phycisphaerae bacterium]
VSVEIEVACRLIANGGYEADEYGEALMSIDNTLIGVAPNDYLARFGGDGNTPAEDMDSGWVSRVFSLSLSAGSHELVVGGFNNKGTASTEITQIYFDNIRVTAFYSTAPDTDTDGIIDSCDNCPAAPNAGQEDDDDDSVGNDCDLCADTVPGATVDAGGCPPIIPGDADRDGDVDSQDCAAFEACASGPAVPYAGQCGNWDFDLDTDVDLYDFAVFQRCFSGADLPADPDCAG